MYVSDGICARVHENCGTQCLRNPGPGFKDFMQCTTCPLYHYERGMQCLCNHGPGSNHFMGITCPLQHYERVQCLTPGYIAKKPLL